MKSILFDSSTLISLAITCSCPILEKLHADYGGEFYISKSVQEETIGRASKSKRFKYEAYRLKNLVDAGVFKMYDESKFSSQISQLADLANSTCFAYGKQVKIIHPGEVSLLVGAKSLGADAIAIDERTTRLLVEAPEQVAQLLERKLHTRIEVDSKKLAQVAKELAGIRIIRSADLALAAFKKGYFGKPSKDLLDGVLWALRFAGCAISSKEIDDYVYTLSK